MIAKGLPPELYRMSADNIRDRMLRPQTKLPSGNLSVGETIYTPAQWKAEKRRDLATIRLLERYAAQAEKAQAKKLEKYRAAMAREEKRRIARIQKASPSLRAQSWRERMGLP
jgi:hypothetical protein